MLRVKKKGEKKKKKKGNQRLEISLSLLKPQTLSARDNKDQK